MLKQSCYPQTSLRAAQTSISNADIELILVSIVLSLQFFEGNLLIKHVFLHYQKRS